MIRDAREPIKSPRGAETDLPAGGGSPEPVAAVSGVEPKGPAMACRWILATGAPISHPTALADPRPPAMGPWLVGETANDTGSFGRSEDFCPVDALATAMPALEHALGSWLFEQLADDYLTGLGEEDLSMASLAEGFADHLTLTRPDHDQPVGERNPWGDFLIELAIFEASYQRVGEAAEPPESEAPSSLSRRSERRGVVMGPWGEVGSEALSLAPHCAVHRFAFPVDSYRLSVLRGEKPEDPEPRSTHLVIENRDGAPRARRLGGAAYRALGALARGGSLEEARQAAEVRLPTFHGLLVRWIAQGWLVPTRHLSKKRRLARG